MDRREFLLLLGTGLLSLAGARAAGSYLLNVSDQAVTLDFYAADSSSRTQRFILRRADV